MAVATVASILAALQAAGGAAQGIYGAIKGKDEMDAYRDWLEAENADTESRALDLPDAVPYTSEADAAYSPTSDIGQALTEYSTLYDTYKTGQLTDADKAQLSLQMKDVNQAEKAQRDALQTQYAQRGMANSGLEQMAQLQNIQGGADARAEAAQRNSILAQKNALDALQNQATLAGNKAQITTSAKDAAAQFNEKMKMEAANTKFNALGKKVNPHEDFINYYGNMGSGGFKTASGGLDKLFSTFNK